jgi:hypothetical protein
MGPRSGPGYAVLDHHHLIDPIRPTRRHIAISSHSAYTRCLRCTGAPRRPATGSRLSLHIPSSHAILNDSGDFNIDSSSQRCRHGLHREITGSAFPIPPAIRFTRGHPFRGFHSSHICYGLPVCSPPCTDPSSFLAVGRDRGTARATLGQGLAVSAFPLYVPV